MVKARLQKRVNSKVKELEFRAHETNGAQTVQAGAQRHKLVQVCEKS